MDDIKIIGVDLGSTFTGVALLTADPLYRKITSIEAVTISTPDIVRSRYHTGKSHDELTALERNAIVNTLVVDWIEERDVNAVIFEQPFMNRFRPMSYGVLITQMNKLAFMVDTLPQVIRIESYAVQSCKKSIGAAGIKGKDVIKDTMRDHSELKPMLPDDFETLSEHAIDAILVAYTDLLNKR